LDKSKKWVSKDLSKTDRGTALIGGYFIKKALPIGQKRFFEYKTVLPKMLISNLSFPVSRS